MTSPPPELRRPCAAHRSEVNCGTGILSAAIATRRAFGHMSRMSHDLVLIVDFGSQVTQLIARRVREAGVYCEIHPFSRAGRGVRAARAQGGDLLRRAGVGSGTGKPARAGGDLQERGPDPRHLLRPADLVRAARRQGRGRPCGGIRPGGSRNPRALGPVRRRLANRRALSGVDEPRRPGDAPTRGLPRLRGVGKRALCGRRGRGAPLLYDHVPPRGGSYARRREAHRQFPAQDLWPQRRLDDGRLPQ